MGKDLRSILRSIKKTDVIWRYRYNLPQTMTYAFGLEKGLTETEGQIVRELNEDGISVRTVDSLGENSDLGALGPAVDDLLASQKRAIEDLKLNAGNDAAIGSKTFNLETLGSELTFDAESVFARAALNDVLINIANAYLGMHAKLRYYNVWYTAASSSSSRESQLWHFDREDNYILKVFLYLDDVDEGAGPFTYAPGTHRKGRFRSLSPEFFLEGGVRRTNDEQMTAAYPRKNWKQCTGGKGTIIFADTRGYHKGGEARTKDRLMYTCMFTSPASESKELIKFSTDFDPHRLTRKQRWALGLR